MKVNGAILILMLAVFAGACSSGSQGSSRQSPFKPLPSGPPNPAETSSAAQPEEASESGKSSAQSAETKAKRPELPNIAASVSTGLIGFSAQAPPEAAELPRKDKQKVVLNFDKADLQEVTNQIFGDYLKLNYVLDPLLQGRISMYIDGEFTKEELFQMVTKVYEANNVSIVPRKGIYYVQPIQKSSSSSLSVANALTLKEDKQGVKPVIVIYRLRFMDVKQAMSTIRFFLTPGRPITSDNLTNSLIFVEDTDNARAIVEVLKALDINILREVSMEIIPLQSIAPQDAAQSVEVVMNKLGVFKDSSIKNSLALIPLQSFGGVLVLAHDSEVLKTARYWLTALDVHTQESGEQINVYFVQNGLAADIADILNQVYGLGSGSSRPSRQVVQSIRPSSGRGAFGSSSSGFGSGSSGGFGSGSSSGFGSSSSGAFGSSSSGSGFGSSSYGSRTGTSGTGSSQGQTGTTRVGGGQGGFGTSGQKKMSGLSGDVVIIPDEVNNAIVIKANAPDYAKIKKTLETLDILPRAVLIEMMIAEVTLTKDFEYGLQYFFKNINTGNGKFTAGHGKTNYNGTVSSLINTTGLNLFWSDFSGNIQILLSLLSEKTSVNVLSTPTLLATDNKEASITVGGRQPIPLGTTISSDTTYSSIDYEETGVIMNVIPHINAGGLVRLEVEQTIRTIDNESVTVGNDSTAPSFLERNIKTTLLAQDGATVVIGGIIQQQTTTSKKGIPWFQDIPIISPLFTNRNDSTKRTELIIAITPHVVNHRESEATREFMEKLRELRGRIDNTRL